MHVDFDTVADALYVQFREPRGPVLTHRLDRLRAVDEDGDGPVGVEILSVSTGIDLTELPHRELIEEALRTIALPA